MPSFATNAIIAAHVAALRVHGETVSIRIGDQVIPDVEVLPGKTSAETFDKMGLATTVELQDWIIQGSLLTVDEQRVTPERNWIIEHSHNGVMLQFAVHHPDRNQAPFRRCDTLGTIVRIHTVLIDEQETES